MEHLYDVDDSGSMTDGLRDASRSSTGTAGGAGALGGTNAGSTRTLRPPADDLSTLSGAADTMAEHVRRVDMDALQAAADEDGFELKGAAARTATRLLAAVKELVLKQHHLTRHLIATGIPIAGASVGSHACLDRASCSCCLAVVGCTYVLNPACRPRRRLTQLQCCCSRSIRHGINTSVPVSGDGNADRGRRRCRAALDRRRRGHHPSREPARRRKGPARAGASGAGSHMGRAAQFGAFAGRSRLCRRGPTRARVRCRLFQRTAQRRRMAQHGAAGSTEHGPPPSLQGSASDGDRRRGSSATVHCLLAMCMRRELPGTLSITHTHRHTRPARSRQQTFRTTAACQRLASTRFCLASLPSSSSNTTTVT